MSKRRTLIAVRPDYPNGQLVLDNTLEISNSAGADLETLNKVVTAFLCVIVKSHLKSVNADNLVGIGVELEVRPV